MTGKAVSSLVFALSVGMGSLHADPPVASYIFPPGGQRGKTVNIRVGGLNLYRSCSFDLTGAGVRASQQLQRIKTVWFEGPLLPLPDSQQQEDYPKDLAGKVRIAADAPLGVRYARLWNSQGAAGPLKFVVGDLPEIVEEEVDGDPVAVAVRLPVTINGRIFPRENVDVWTFTARKDQTITCEVNAARLGSPLDSRLEVRDPKGKVIAENDDTFGADSFVRFTAPAAGKYQVRIHDINYRGGQAYVYRLTLTADPYVDRVFPLGGRRGSKVQLELAGQGLPRESVELALPASRPATYHARLKIGGKLTNPVLLELDDLPEHVGAAADARAAHGKPIALPAVLNGRIYKPGAVNYWAVTLKKGQEYLFDLRAGRLGSPLCGVLTITDAAGKQLARADGLSAGLDPVLRFTAPATGIYGVRVAGYFRSRGGPEYAYRLRIARPNPKPDFRLHLGAGALTVNRGGLTKLKVLVDRTGGFSGPVALRIDGLPKGVSVLGTTIAGPQGGVTFKTDASTSIQGVHLTLHGSATIAGRTVTRIATFPAARGETELASLLLAVALPTPFKITGKYDMQWAARGTVLRRHYRIKRGGFQGPIRVRMADHQARHLQGITGPTITVPAGASEFDYPVFLPPWMETGRTARACVMAVGEVKDADGRTHTVSFTSVQPNEQVIAVVEPGRLEVEPDRTSLTAVPGKAVRLAVGVARGKNLRGPVKLELVVPPHLRGISAAPVTVPAKGKTGRLLIRFGSSLKGPYNAPLVIRATCMEGKDPVVGEARLELGIRH
jgi:hypothetical protein